MDSLLQWYVSELSMFLIHTVLIISWYKLDINPDWNITSNALYSSHLVELVAMEMAEWVF